MIHIINGPNLNLIGKREPSIYGNQNMDDYISKLLNKYANQEVSYFQSNIEGELINKIQTVTQSDSIIINAGAYSHTSIGIADALKAISPKQIIEVHISNIYAREEYRRHSYIASVSTGTIVGLGLKGYELALLCLLKQV